MATTRISAAEAVRDFNALLARIQAGESFLIEQETLPPAVMAAPNNQLRLLSEVIDSMKSQETVCTEPPVLDEEFAAAVRERISNRKPRELDRWA